MAIGRSDVARQFQTLFSLGTAAALSDGELLDRFASRTGVAAEAAFAVLVERHGPVVLRVCRDILRDPNDAEDAFQATFLVLVRQARSIRQRESVASWLYGVALRVAARGRLSAMRRRAHERKAAERTPGQVVEVERACDDLDLGPVLHEEVGRLPEKYRAAVVLCYWQGLTHEQAAARLHWPVGTVRSRLAWARRRLRSRMVRRGLAPSVALISVSSSASASALGPVSGVLLESTIQGALRFATVRMPWGVASTSAWVLAEGVIKTMLFVRLKVTALVLLSTGIMAAGAAGLAQQEHDPDPVPQRPAEAPAPEGDPAPPSPPAASPAREPYYTSHLENLKAYYRELQDKINLQEEQWLKLAAEENLDLSQGIPNRITLDEYRQVRNQLFQVEMDIIKAEALFDNRREVIETDEAALVTQRRMQEEIRDDPEIARLLGQIKRARRRVDQITRLVRSPSTDPAAITARRELSELEDQLWKHLDRLRFGDATVLLGREQSKRIEDMKARKQEYKELLSKIEETIRRQQINAVKATLLHEDLATLREMQHSVGRRIEQLQFDAGAARRR